MAKDPFQPVDDEARRLAKALVRGSRHGALASLLPDGGGPLASRVLVASDVHGHPLLLVSALSAHAGALASEPRCSLLFGEVGGGDPLKSPRISLFGHASALSGEARTAARTRFLKRHPAAELYVDFPDFTFFRVEIAAANLNGGFARAYRLEAGDLVEPARPDLEAALQRAIDHMNEDHGDAIDRIAQHRLGRVGEGWCIVTGDRAGFEIAEGDRLARIPFERPIDAPAEMREAYVALVRAIPAEGAQPA